MLKKVAVVFGVLLAVPLLQAQVGPTVFTPRLTVSPGPLTVSTGDTTVQDLIINGTCTGCTVTPPGGADTQVQYNDSGAFGGDTALTWNETTDTLTSANLVLTTALPVASGGTGTTTSTGTGSVVRSAGPTLTGTTTVADLTVSGTCTGCGQTAPGGSNTQVQFNNSSAFGGDADFTYTTGATDTLGLAGILSLTKVGTPTSQTAQMISTRPMLQMRQSDASSNNGNWTIQAVAEAFIISAYDDANSAVTNWLRVERTGTTIDDIQFSGTAVSVNGSNVCTANGTNCPAGSSTIESPTCNGFSSTTACALRWTDLGAQVCATVSVAGTSNATTFTITNVNMPDPVYVPNNSSPMHTVDNGVSAITLVTVDSTATTVTFTYGATFATNGFTASGSKGSSGSFCFGITP